MKASYHEDIHNKQELWCFPFSFIFLIDIKSVHFILREGGKEEKNEDISLAYISIPTNIFIQKTRNYS
jgi:hypothetical protein